MDTTIDAGQSTSGSQHGHTVPIFIDKDKFEVVEGPMTGQALRDLPTPPVPADRDLWLGVPGADDDVLIQPTKTYQVKAGMHFYTAPATINPGSGH